MPMLCSSSFSEAFPEQYLASCLLSRLDVVLHSSLARLTAVSGPLLVSIFTSLARLAAVAVAIDF